jgi:hypothetical protein
MSQYNNRSLAAAKNNPQTTGPAEKLREEAAENVDENEEAAEQV